MKSEVNPGSQAEPCTVSLMLQIDANDYSRVLDACQLLGEERGGTCSVRQLISQGLWTLVKDLETRARDREREERESDTE